MKLSKLKLAYNKEGALINIYDADKNESFYLDEDREILLIVVDKYNRKDKTEVSKHYKRDPKTPQEIIDNYCGASESIEHLNAKRQILLDGGITIGYYFVKANRVELEVRFPETNNIIDAVLYDSDDKVLMGVEICHTNKKSEEDINKLNKLNIIIYESYTNDRETECICTGRAFDESKPIRAEIKKYKSSMRVRLEAIRGRAWEGNREVYKLERRVKEAEDRNKELRESDERARRDSFFYSDNGAAENHIEFYEEELKRATGKVQRHLRAIKSMEDYQRNRLNNKDNNNDK